MKPHQSDHRQREQRLIHPLGLQHGAALSLIEEQSLRTAVLCQAAADVLSVATNVSSDLKHGGAPVTYRQ